MISREEAQKDWSPFRKWMYGTGKLPTPIFMDREHTRQFYVDLESKTVEFLRQINTKEVEP